MIGRQIILTNRSFTLDELEDFMRDYWDIEQYGEFTKGAPTKASVEDYILLPATPRYLVCVYSRAAGTMFSKDNKVILITASTPQGAKEMLARSIPTRGILAGAAKISSSMSSEKERKGPAEEVLLEYAEYMRSLLKEAGYLK